MNAFESAKKVEFLVWQRLRPFIDEISNGRFVLVNKGFHAKRLQEQLGDIIANLAPVHAPHLDPYSPEGRLIAIEIKGEEINSANLYLETWSNRNLNDAQSHAARGSNPGWMFKLRSDLIFYYFLNSDKLCVISTLALKRWAFDGQPWHLLTYPEKPQRRREQLNDTWGACVPIDDLQQALGQKCFKLTTGRQLGLFDTWNVA